MHQDDNPILTPDRRILVPESAARDSQQENPQSENQQVALPLQFVAPVALVLNIQQAAGKPPVMMHIPPGTGLVLQTVQQVALAHAKLQQERADRAKAEAEALQKSPSSSVSNSSE